MAKTDLIAESRREKKRIPTRDLGAEPRYQPRRLISSVLTSNIQHTANPTMDFPIPRDPLEYVLTYQ